MIEDVTITDVAIDDVNNKDGRRAARAAIRDRLSLLPALGELERTGHDFNQMVVILAGGREFRAIEADPAALVFFGVLLEEDGTIPDDPEDWTLWLICGLQEDLTGAPPGVPRVPTIARYDDMDRIRNEGEAGVVDMYPITAVQHCVRRKAIH